MSMTSDSGAWTLKCEKCGQTFTGLETWQVDGEATGHDHKPTDARFSALPEGKE